MIRLLSVLFLVPMVAFAEPVTIRSGEHETFSRLVLAIGEGTDWQVSNSQDGYVLTLSGPGEGFDTDTVFDRIPQTRLIDLAEQDRETLSLVSTCDCYVDAFLWQPGQLVIDIVDGPDPNVVIPTNEPEQSRSTTAQDDGLMLPNLLALQIMSDADVASAAAPMALQAPPQSLDVQATESALLEGLARAATQGILTPAVADRPVLESPDPDPVEEIVIQQMPDPNPLNGQPGIGISTAIDRDLALLGDVLESAVGQQCLSGDLFEINDWADERAFHAQVASLAEGLAGEFGEEPREAQDALARLYLHFGFGAEARAVISTDKALSQSRQVMIELAGIIDDYPGNYSLIAAQKGCTTPAALWAFYVDPTAMEGEDRNHITQQFFALPQPLRGQIAPRLAQAFIAVNDADTAAELLRAAERNDADTTHEVQATRALIAQELDNPELAIAVLAQEASDNARTTPESLIRLMTLGLEQGLPPNEEDLELVAAMRQEFRDTPIAENLTLTEAKGRIALGQYERALALVDERDTQGAKDVIDRAFAHMAENAPSPVFLDFGFADLPAALTAQTENEMARRMIDLGFPERAVELLQGDANREAAAERRFLRAEAAFGIGDYVSVIDGLIGLTNPRANDLRSRAYSALGDHRSALETSNFGTTEGDVAALQFRAQAWERLSIEDDAALAGFAGAFLTPQEGDIAETLADRRALLAQSEESRRAVEALLQRFDGAMLEE